jgi:hypothetical protein
MVSPGPARPTRALAPHRRTTPRTVSASCRMKSIGEVRLHRLSSADARRTTSEFQSASVHDRIAIAANLSFPCFRSSTSGEALSAAPRPCVSFSQALTALHEAGQRDPKVLGRLLASARRFQSDATARRVGLLVDRLFGSDAAAPFRELIGESRTPTLLRRGGRTDGSIDPTWRVIVNARTVPETAGSK